MSILVTGGAGFIGSHTVVELQNAGFDVVVLDNLANSSEKSLARVEKITGKKVKFYKADILNRDALNKIFDTEKVDSVIHFAGLKAVGESVAKPWEYYENNIAGTLTLVDVFAIVFAIPFGLSKSIKKSKDHQVFTLFLMLINLVVYLTINFFPFFT